MRIKLEDLAGLVGENCEELDDGVLGHHVEGEGVGHSVLRAGRDGDVVAGHREVAQDARGLGGALGERLGRLEQAANEDNVNGAILVVGDVDQGLGEATVHKLDSEDVGIGEGRHDVDLELGCLFGDGGLGISSLVTAVSNLGSKATVRHEGGTYVGGEDGSYAQGEQRESRPLVVNHFAGYAETKGSWMDRRRSLGWLSKSQELAGQGR